MMGDQTWDAMHYELAVISPDQHFNNNNNNNNIANNNRSNNNGNGHNNNKSKADKPNGSSPEDGFDGRKAKNA